MLKCAVAASGRGYGDVEQSERFVFRVAGTTFSPLESLRVALEQTVGFFLQRNKEVWLILQVPELGFNISECIGRPVSFEHKLRMPCVVPKEDVLSRQAPYRLVVDSVTAKQPALKIYDPLPAMCDDRSCFGILGDTVLYQDDDHLSRNGSLFFADKFAF